MKCELCALPDDVDSKEALEVTLELENFAEEMKSTTNDYTGSEISNIRNHEFYCKYSRPFRTRANCFLAQEAVLIQTSRNSMKTRDLNVTQRTVFFSSNPA
ncbi:hypothetical protein HNY73_005669 [Argiope bruennichi]|uniref:Uncharacterized protein n=1 Tax=Argiope bruennichi TaxID=94029 RepID=A0A8T0FJP9_ARGBR|nr:hypothetical protein HNY73_005669 [Argiope bruennichi]